MTGNEPTSIFGQWIGRTDGDPEGLIVMDLDSVGNRVKGKLYLYPDSEEIPSSMVDIDVPDRLEEISLDGEAIHFLSHSGYVPTWSELDEQFPTVNLPDRASGAFYLVSENEISLKWETPIATYGGGILNRTLQRQTSRVRPVENVTSWDEYQRYLTSGASVGKIFRGQGSPWPLKTSFHRTNRRDVKRYLDEDIPRLHHALSARTKHIFNLANPIENGAFLNLAQHHGYPTPLLDWTKSPFIAAYFAFRDVAHDATNFVRVFCFDRSGFVRKFPQYSSLTLLIPHFSILEALAIENERAVPQQGILALTNVEDIEQHILDLEEYPGQYLTAFDLPVSEKPKVLDDLRLMGITSATLFPGMDGICSELRATQFE